MNELGRPAELATAYEALRAQATGQMPSTTPRGLALYLSAGLSAWMRAWTPLTPMCAPASPRVMGPPGHSADEVVRLLTEMALACRHRWAA